MKLILTFLALFYLIGSIAQHQIQLISEDDQLPIPGAKMSYRYITESEFTILVSDINGNFSIPQNNFHNIVELKITAIGFENFADTLSIYQTKTITLKRTILDAVCVTTQYQPTMVSNAVQKITIISADQIQKSGAVNLADIITYQTGIRLSQDNILGTSINIGGISGENVKILIDGVPVIGRLNGSVDLSQINLNSVERIELIEGPLSVNYGTNALGGTINLITKKQKEKGVQLALNPYYENTGNYNFNFTAGVQLKKNAITFSGGRNYFDGWSKHENFIEFPKEKPADTNRFLDWKPKEQYFGEIRYQALLKDWQINPYVRYFEEKITNRGFPKAPYYESAFDDYYYTWRTDAGVLIDKKFKKARLNTIVAYNNFERIKNTYFNDLTTLNTVMSETPGAQDTSAFSLFNTRIIFNSLFAKKINFEVGADLSYESAIGARIENTRQEMGDYAAFATSEWQPIKNLVFKPGIRYAYNTIYNAPVIPSIHVKYKTIFGADKKQSLIYRISIAKGFRAPSLKELYFDFVDINHNITGNKELLAENSINYNASIGWMFQSKKNTLFKIDLSAYYNDIHNLITLGLDGTNSYTYLNVGEYKTIGQQISMNMRQKKLSVQINASYIGRYNAVSTDTEIEPFNFSPEIGSQISYSFLKEKLSLNLFYKYNGPLQTFYIDADNVINTSIQKSYQILDMTLGIKTLKNRLIITTGAKNIFNVTTVAVSGQTAGIHSSESNMNMARGFSVFIGLNYQLNLPFTKNEK